MTRGKGLILITIILAVNFFASVTALSFFFTPTVTAGTKARDLLERRQCGFHTIRLKKGKKNKLGEFTILLAVEDIRTREIHVIGAHPKHDGSTKTIVIEPGKSNGLNIKFTVIYPEKNIMRP